MNREYLNNNLSNFISNDNEQESNKRIWSLFEENILYEDENHININKEKLSWRSFIGSMSHIDNIYRKDNFMKNFKRFKFLLILIDSIFRGISQVMFANNPLSGVIITIGLFIGNWELTLYGILGTTCSTLTAHLFHFNYNSIRAGLYGYNGCLTAMAIGYFTFAKSPQIIPFVIIMSIFSTIFYQSISKILVHRLGIPPFTFSFQVSSWIWLLGALKYRYYFINGNILSPTLLTTVVNKPQLLNVSFPGYSVEDNFVGFFASIAQVFFIEYPYTGGIILVGVGLCSRILAFFALFGAVTGQLTAAYLLGLPRNAIYNGLWGYNTVLTCQALGGMFLVLYGYQIWLFTLYGSILTIFVQGAVSSFLSSCGMPTFTFPFTFICWIFCLMIPTKNLVPVKLTDCNIPEDHLYRYRLSKFVKTEFKYMNKLSSIISSLNEDITNIELIKIEKEFIPILMSTYTFRNDLKKMKILFNKINNIHCIDFTNRTPLHISACQGYLRISKWLIKKVKININSMDNFGSTPLFDGFINGNLNVTNYIYLNGGKFPSTKYKELSFYLNAFIYENYIDGIKYLIQLGFNPNETDYDGRYSLHLAVNTNNLNIIRYLVEQTSISLDIKDHFNKTPYQYALELSQSDIANYLLEKKNQIIINKNIQIITKVDSTEQINNKNNISSISLEQNLLPYLLSISANDNNIDKLANFINEYPNIKVFDCFDYDNRYLSHIAAIKGQFEIIKYLSEYCSKSHFQQIINREDRWNLSTLDYAFIYKHNHIINFIKEHLLSMENNSIEYEINSQNKTMISILNKWKKIYLFLTLSASGNTQRIESLFNRGYFVKQELYADYDGRTPMHLATTYGHIDVIQLLIHLGYHGINHKDRWGYSPLDIALQMKFNNIIYILQQQTH
ncbi:unnamed protein product [Rotaria sp. Silwood1]|nr:unnamed protein product [Rotaria sp. Silwood1]CAF1622206.1 unnamed protein product [Rotaria sp. Silwood1]CAF3714543.1 unnamed protein product [Rotaria sp. Silwood1]CAF3748081.1 unnamed protein product [Rotaria sp. Silwood1]CAF4619332.1 unnamed protein product [Rotaria sp. Silwood1]